jgi:hypothetical protein
VNCDYCDKPAYALVRMRNGVPWLPGSRGERNLCNEHYVGPYGEHVPYGDFLLLKVYRQNTTKVALELGEYSPERAREPQAIEGGTITRINADYGRPFFETGTAYTVRPTRNPNLATRVVITNDIHLNYTGRGLVHETLDRIQREMNERVDRQLMERVFGVPGNNNQRNDQERRDGGDGERVREGG